VFSVRSQVSSGFGGLCVDPRQASVRCTRHVFWEAIGRVHASVLGGGRAEVRGQLILVVMFRFDEGEELIRL
jgi:hypothetical protein